ncbi:MAG: hypothetical protein ABSE51_04005 [Terracidiphilus sp.]
MSVMAVIEFVLWVAIGVLFWKKRLQLRFPVMGAYLALHVTSTPLLLLLYSADWLVAYFCIYWAVYLASAVLLLFICLEVFRSALSAFSGLKRLGIVVFRWTILLSVIVSLSVLPFEHPHALNIPDVAYRLMRSVSILELGLLGFLCLSMHALHLKTRDMAFGISLGFGVLSANDFVQSLLTTVHTPLADPVQFVGEGIVLAGLGVWVAYFALPEPPREPLVIPVNSVILRWNEIACALGHTGTQVALQPTGGFVLTDAERVVAKALTQGMKSRES